MSVICGSDLAESVFNPTTNKDGIDFEFDGFNELFIRVRYRRIPFGMRNSEDINRVDPLLSRLICRQNPYFPSVFALEQVAEVVAHESNNAELLSIVVEGSEFEFEDKIFRVTRIDFQTNHVLANCVYPRHASLSNAEQSFDALMARQLILERLES